MKKIMFDSNAYDELAKRNIDWKKFHEKSVGRYEYFITTIQEDELGEIDVSKHEKKIEIDTILDQLKPNMTDAIAVVGKSRVGLCYLPSEEECSTYDSVMAGNAKNSNDANIGVSAQREGCIVVTNDNKFLKRGKRNNLKIMSFEDWWEEFIICEE